MAAKILKRFAQAQPAFGTNPAADRARALSPGGIPVPPPRAGVPVQGGPQTPLQGGRNLVAPPTQAYPRGNEMDTFGGPDQSEDIVALMRLRAQMLQALKAYRPLADQVSKSYDDYRQSMTQLGQIDDELSTKKQQNQQLDVEYHAKLNQLALIHRQGIEGLKAKYDPQMQQLQQQIQALELAAGGAGTKPRATAPGATAPATPSATTPGATAPGARLTPYTPPAGSSTPPASSYAYNDGASDMSGLPTTRVSGKRSASMEREAIAPLVIGAIVAGVAVVSFFWPNIRDFFTGKGKQSAEQAQAAGDTGHVQEFLELSRQMTALQQQIGSDKLQIDQAYESGKQEQDSSYKQLKQGLTGDINNLNAQLNELQNEVQQNRNELNSNMQNESRARAALDNINKQVAPYVDEDAGGQ
jgi:outer membrane murein-binding lipoprotein Lpp